MRAVHLGERLESEKSLQIVDRASTHDHHPATGRFHDRLYERHDARVGQGGVAFYVEGRERAIVIENEEPLGPVGDAVEETVQICSFLEDLHFYDCPL